jgi:hypothetical protein
MKPALALVGIGLISLLVAASPFHLFCDISEAVTIGETGWTNLLFKITADGPMIHVGRAIGRRMDICATVAPWDLFGLGLRVLVVKDLGPLNAVLTATKDEIVFTSGLRLGPIHLDWGRGVGPSDRRFGTLVAFPEQRIAMVLGLEVIGGSTYPLLGVRLFPDNGLVGGSFLIRKTGCSLTFGGTF